MNFNVDILAYGTSFCADDREAKDLSTQCSDTKCHPIYVNGPLVEFELFEN